MEIYVEGQKVASLPQLTIEEKLQNATVKLQHYWNTKLRNFWRNAYIHYRDEFYGNNKKAGKHAATRNPADNGNHDDGKPAA